MPLMLQYFYGSFEPFKIPTTISLVLHQLCMPYNTFLVEEVHICLIFKALARVTINFF